MNVLAQAVYVEALKARRSRMTLFTGLGVMLLPLACGFFMVVLKDPELARRMGLISAKARIIAGAADWPTYLGLLAQAVAGGGMILFGLIAAWVFGREYSDRTLKDLLALPTSRSTIVTAKFIVIAVWSVILTAVICLVGLGVGAVIGLDRASSPAIVRDGLRIARAACLTIALLTPLAFFASVGHGYLAPIGFVFLALLLAQVIGAAGWGEFFPWSIPLLSSQGTPLGPASYIIIALTSIAGVVGTLVYWERADHTA